MSFFSRLDLAKQQSISELALKLGEEELDLIRHNHCRMAKHQSDSTPSMKVYTDTNSFYCFGCKSSGSTVDYAMGVKSIGIYEAVQLIERLFGLSRIRNTAGVRTKIARQQLDRIKNKFSREDFDSIEYAKSVENKLRPIFDSIQQKLSTPLGKENFWKEVDLVYLDLDKAAELGASKEDLDELFEFYKEKFAEHEQMLQRTSEFTPL